MSRASTEDRGADNNWKKYDIRDSRVNDADVSESGAFEGEEGDAYINSKHNHSNPSGKHYS
jgi:hypothetical protein